MKILVTGGSGVLGGYALRELLAGGHQVTEYSRTAPRVSGVEFVAGDIFELEKLTDACRGHDAILHMAAVPGPGRATTSELMRVNVVGTVNALEAALAAGVGNFVFTSSGAANGFTFQKHKLTPRYLPLDEEHPAEPEDDYGLSKLLGELTCKRYTDAFGLQTICLRVNHNWYLDRAGTQAVLGAGWARNMKSPEEIWQSRYVKTLTDPDGVWPTPGPPPPLNLLWAVTDARDAGQSFRLAVEAKNLKHEVFQINADDTCSFEETPALIQKHYRDVPLRAKLQGFDTLVSHEKATRMLDYRPQYTWRKSEFREWFDREQASSASK